MAHVASFMDAWIETAAAPQLRGNAEVASFMDAWIETAEDIAGLDELSRRILHGCVD